MIWFAKLSICIGLDVGKFASPIQFVSKWKFEMAIAYGCYDANMETKSGKILRIFQNQVGAVTILPPLQESRPEILGLSEKGGVFLAKTSFSFPCGFFFGMVGPLDFEELDGLVAGFPFRFIQDADRMLAVS